MIRSGLLGADYQAGKLNINAMYLKGDNDYIDSLKDTDDDGYVFGLNMPGLKPANRAAGACMPNTMTRQLPLSWLIP